MTVKATNWAWHHSPESITGNELIVLMALADIANDDGYCIFGASSDRKQDALAQKARVSRRTFQRVIKELVETHKVLSIEVTGRSNAYRLHFDVTQQAEADRRQSVVLVTSEEIGVNLSSDDTGGAADASTVAHHKNHLTKDYRDLVPDATTEAAALRADDEDSSSGRLSLRARSRKARAKRALDIESLNDQVGHIFVDVQGAERSRRIVYLVALRILGKAAKAGTDLSDPTRYVVASIASEPEVWHKFAFGLDVRP